MIHICSLCGCCGDVVCHLGLCVFVILERNGGTVRRLLAGLAVWQVLGMGMFGGCIAGCSYAHTAAGVTNVHAEVAGTEDGKAAFMADWNYSDSSFKIEGNPLAFASRVVQDGGAFVRGVIGQFRPRPRPSAKTTSAPVIATAGP